MTWWKKLLKITLMSLIHFSWINSKFTWKNSWWRVWTSQPTGSPGNGKNAVRSYWVHSIDYRFSNLIFIMIFFRILYKNLLFWKSIIFIIKLFKKGSPNFLRFLQNETTTQIHCHMLIWMKDQPDIMEALNCKDKKKQDELLQNACDW